MSIILNGSTGIVAPAGTFSGDVGVGGTLTYEDVTNIDSVGLITARSGVNVTGGDVTLSIGSSIGIGTDNPTTQLEILGSASGGSSYSAIKINNSNFGGGSIDFSNSTTANLGSISLITEDLSAGVYNDGILVFKTAADASNTERFRIASRGAWGLSGANYGTSGQVLTSQGSGSAPQWATPAGGAWQFISSVTASNSASVAFTSGLDSTYDIYVITYDKVRESTGNSGEVLRMRFSTNGGSSYYSGGTDYAGNGSGNVDHISVTQIGFADANLPRSGFVYLYNLSSTSYYKGAASTTPFGASSNQLVSVGYLKVSASAVNAVQFYINSYNIASGTFRLYGIKNS